ncbi:AAA family ATPase [soil metagenome]
MRFLPRLIGEWRAMYLMERAAYLDSLDVYLRWAAEGRGNMVLIGGEAGAGKTALVQCFAKQARDKRVRELIGACDSMSTPRPLGPLFDVASDLGRPVRQLLGNPNRINELLDTLLDALSAGGPTLFVIEDVHWADEATLDLLRFLGRRIDRTRTLLMVTYRDDEVTSKHRGLSVLGDLATQQAVRRLKIDLLSEGAVHRLTDGTGIDPAELYCKTDGNPFYVTEVISAGTGVVPATVRDAVLTRCARLSPAGRATLDVAAVIGGRIEPWLLARVAGETADAVDECLNVGLLEVHDGALQLRHQLTQDAVVDAISLLKRMELHATVLLALRQRVTTVGDYTRLAHHAEAADDTESVLEYAPAAGDHASELGAHREAAIQYARALRFADRSTDDAREQLLTCWLQSSDVTGAIADSLKACEKLLAIARSAGDRKKEAQWLAWQSRVLVSAGRNTAAEEAIRAALKLLQEVPPDRAHAFVFRVQASIRMLNRDYEQAISCGGRAIELARRFDDTETLVGAMNAVGSARLIKGDEQQGRADLEAGLAIAREARLISDIASCLGNLGSAHGEIFQFELADRYLSEGLEFTLAHDLDGYRWYVAAWLGLTRMFQGRWSEAADVAESIVLAPGANTISNIMALIAFGRVRARRGDPEVWMALDEALDLATPTDTLQRLAPVREARAEAAWLAGEPERAATEARAGYGLAIRHRHAWHIGELAYWQWKAGALTEPPTDAAEPYSLQIAGDWMSAAARWRELGCPYETTRALAESDDENALREAFAKFDLLGARPAAAMVAQRLRELGARSIPRGVRPATRANSALLTPRELQVLAMIAEDTTNAEIAARLYLSPKTIEHHVSSILAKLGVRSRRDAVRRSGELNLLDQDEGHRPQN